MTPQEKAEIENELVAKYVLVPKNKLYYIIGGAVAVVVIATGFSLGAVFTYLRSEPAEILRNRIQKIAEEAETYLVRLKDQGSYVRYGDSVALQSGLNDEPDKPPRVLFSHSGQAPDKMGGVVVSATNKAKGTDAGSQWKVKKWPTE